VVNSVGREKVKRQGAGGKGQGAKLFMSKKPGFRANKRLAFKKGVIKKNSQLTTHNSQKKTVLHDSIPVIQHSHLFNKPL
jgi:hypothetical protein